jgi:hypothetical protein
MGREQCCDGGLLVKGSRALVNRPSAVRFTGKNFLIAAPSKPNGQEYFGKTKPNYRK